MLIQATIYVILSTLVDWRPTAMSLVTGAVITLALNKLVRTARKAGSTQTRRTQLLV